MLDRTEATEVAGALVRAYYEAVFEKNFDVIATFYSSESSFTLVDGAAPAADTVGASAIKAAVAATFSEGTIIVDSVAVQVTHDGNVLVHLTGAANDRAFMRVILVPHVNGGFYIGSDLVVFTGAAAAAPAAAPAAAAVEIGRAHV